MGKEAILYEKLPNGKVRCTACARYCEIGKDKIGLCGIRGNVGGKLDLFVYGKVIAGNVDPIEKKPVVHYRPGSRIFSIATTGCNWLCQPKGTSVLMADGTKKSIEKIASGDKVWSYDVDNDLAIIPNVVTHTGSRFAEVIQVRYGNRGEGKLNLTREHPVFTSEGWKPAESLKTGDMILKVWYQDTNVWKEKRSDTIQKANFTCGNCEEPFKGIEEWNKHPSEPQKLLYDLLDKIGIEYEREYKIKTQKDIEGAKDFYIADAAILGLKLDIEVDGWWHNNSEKIQQSDKIRDRALRADGWNIIRIPGRQIYSHPQEVESLLLEYITPHIRKNKKSWMEVKEVKNLDKNTQVFSFECIPNHNYVGDGILLHNCKYCQNYDVSQRRKVEGVDMTPEQVVQRTLDYGADGIAYTYNQPSIFIEFARDCGVLARKKGLFNIFVSNGYDTPDTVRMMDEFLDCITVDFKGSAEPKFTQRYIGVPDPQPIFDSLLEIRDKTNIHVEITDLIVPKVGDDLKYAEKLCKFVYDELGPDTPIHFLRFHPDYKMMDFDSTPVKTLEKHYEIAKKAGLNYAYIGNVPGHPLEHTFCPACDNIVVKRFGFDIEGWNLDEKNRCKYCGNKIPITGKLAKEYKKTRFQFVH